LSLIILEFHKQLHNSLCLLYLSLILLMVRLRRFLILFRRLLIIQSCLKPFHLPVHKFLSIQNLFLCFPHKMAQIEQISEFHCLKDAPNRHLRVDPAFALLTKLFDLDQRPNQRQITLGKVANLGQHLVCTIEPNHSLQEIVTKISGFEISLL
jgi:hypothetical protein